LKLEAVPKNEIVSLRAVLAKVLVEFSRCPGLNVADFGAEAVANPHEAVVGSSIPGLVADRTGR